MATNKNITMKQFNGVDYDILYPKTIASQIDDVYSKSETSNLFLPKAGGSMGGILDMNGNRITNLPTPTSNSEPATKEYVDGNKLQKFQIFEIPPKTSDYEKVNLNFSGINNFKYIQVYFYGSYGSYAQSIGMYIGGTTTEIFNLIGLWERESYVIYNFYGFVNGSNILFSGFGGNNSNNYYKVYDVKSINKNDILSNGIDFEYNSDGDDKSYLYCMVF